MDHNFAEVARCNGVIYGLSIPDLHVVIARAYNYMQQDDKMTLQGQQQDTRRQVSGPQEVFQLVARPAFRISPL